MLGEIEEDLLQCRLPNTVSLQIKTSLGHLHFFEQVAPFKTWIRHVVMNIAGVDVLQDGAREGVLNELAQRLELSLPVILNSRVLSAE